MIPAARLHAPVDVGSALHDLAAALAGLTALLGTALFFAVATPFGMAAVVVALPVAATRGIWRAR